MILRVQLGRRKRRYDSEFQDYLTRFGELQRVARAILEKLAAVKLKTNLDARHTLLIDADDTSGRTTSSLRSSSRISSRWWNPAALRARMCPFSTK